MSANSVGSTPQRDPTPAEFAEAAAWLARLRGPNRTESVERGLRRWLDADRAHAAAFEAISAGWEMTGKLAKEPLPRLSRWQRLGYREGFIRSAVAVAGIAALAFGLFFFVLRHELETSIGEQRTLTLEDGTRVTLNTDTRVTVDYDKQHRTVELKSGEAFFDVAKRPSWPFIVKAGDRQVRALGTAFVVRRDAGQTAVTLVEGKVAVAPIDTPEMQLESLSAPTLAAGSVAATPLVDDSIAYLSPGQRLRFAENRAPTIDQPAIEKVIAWRRGLVDFENTPLADAVAEMNRYSVLKLVIEDSSVAAIPITGVFRAGDAASLAAAVSRAYQLQATHADGAIHISGVPVLP